MTAPTQPTDAELAAEAARAKGWKPYIHTRRPETAVAIKLDGGEWVEFSPCWEWRDAGPLLEQMGEVEPVDGRPSQVTYWRDHLSGLWVVSVGGAETVGLTLPRAITLAYLAWQRGMVWK